MKKYLIDLHRLRHNPYNGLYTFSVQLATHLLKHTVDDEELFYYLPKNKYGLFGNMPTYTEHKRWHKFYQPGTQKYDVWHLTTGISQYRPFNKNTKVVFTIHDVHFLVEEPHRLRQNKRTLELMQKNINQASHIVGISNFALQSAAEVLDFGQTPKSVIYNGYTIGDYDSFESPVYRPSKPFLFSVSLVQPRKNFHVLPSLLVGNDYELVIAGLNNFDYKKKVIQEAERWRVADRLKLIGPIDEKSKYWYCKNCAAFMFPSVAEGFGAPPLEAMHFGKPVFLSRYMSLPEIGGEAAYYFDSFEPESMRKVFQNAMNDYEWNKVERISAIKSQSALFNWDRNAQQYLQVYRQLI